MHTPGVLLLASSNIDIANDHELSQDMMFRPDAWLGIYRIKKWLEDRDLAQVLILDPNVDQDVPGMAAEFAAKRQVPIVGVSATRQYIEYDLHNIHTVSTVIAKSGQPAPVCLSGGYESTLGPELILSLGFVDGVVQGFGEFPLQSLLQYYNSLPTPIPDDLRGVQLPHVVWRKDIQPKAELEIDHRSDPSELYRYAAQPHLIIPWTKYWERKAELQRALPAHEASGAHGGKSGTEPHLPEPARTNDGIRLTTSSHCLGTCGFCSSRRYGQQVLKSYGQSPAIMMSSAEEVLQMVLEAYDRIEPKPRGAYFVDDDFVIGGTKGMARFETFCDLMEDAYASGRLPGSFFLGLQTKVRHFVSTDRWPAFRGGGLRAAHSLRRAGFNRLEFGVESLNDELLSSPFIHKQSSAAMNIQVVEDCLQAGLLTSIFYIPFPPDVTALTFQDSLSKLLDLLEKGPNLGLTPNIRIVAGSPASEYVHDHTWPVTFKKIVDLYGTEVEIPSSLYPPADPVMRQAATAAIAKHRKEIYQSLRRNQKPGYLILADTAAFLGSDRLYQRMMDLIESEA